MPIVGPASPSDHRAVRIEWAGSLIVMLAYCTLLPALDGFEDMVCSQITCFLTVRLEQSNC